MESKEEIRQAVDGADTSKKRRDIIATFYNLLCSIGDTSVFNVDLQEHIHITRKSAVETGWHASKSTNSTLAVLELLEILQGARLIETLAIKPDSKKQQQFQKMLFMEYNLVDIGLVKLTVGVGKEEIDNRHIQYCLTAVE